ncbi:NB-ARC domains-containing protein [Tanacetum coccineum]
MCPIGRKLDKAVSLLMDLHVWPMGNHDFCEDVNEFVEKFGMVQLQTQIIEDMTKEDLKISSAGEGSNAMKKIMLSKKVLLILDDVNESDHLEALAGSHVENFYDVELLHDDEAMELFNLYAFNHKQRKDDFRELSEKLVPYMNGHPLALKVFGSAFLFRKMYVNGGDYYFRV